MWALENVCDLPGAQDQCNWTPFTARQSTRHQQRSSTPISPTIEVIFGDAHVLQQIPPESLYNPLPPIPSTQVGHTMNVGNRTKEGICCVKRPSHFNQLPHTFHLQPEADTSMWCLSLGYGLGTVLAHKMPDGSEKPIGYVSHTLTKSKRKYSQLENEGLACIFRSKNSMITSSVLHSNLWRTTNHYLVYSRKTRPRHTAG